MSNVNDIIKTENERLIMFMRADKGELPDCPHCMTGHILSLCGGRIYKCDNPKCNVYIHVYKEA